MTGRMLVTGSQGLIGSHVVTEALRQGWSVTAAGRRPQTCVDPNLWTVTVDLSRPHELSRLVAGHDRVVHAAHATRGSDDELWRVNVVGTRELVAAADSVGVRVDIVSTAAVYGRGPYHDLRPGAVPDAPRSQLSRTRGVADWLVRASGGFACRPHLVVGHGDRWVVPSLASLPPTTVHGATATHSTVHVNDVARLTVALCATSRFAGEIIHCTPKRPVSVRELAERVSTLGLPAAGAGDRAVDAVPALASYLVGDHGLADDGVWEKLGLDSPSDLPSFTDRDERWYRSLMEPAARARCQP